MTQPGLAADDIAEEELRAFAKERRSAVLLQASATVVGAFLPLTAVIFNLAVSIFFIPDPLRVPPQVAWHRRRALVAWNPATANQCATMRYHREQIGPKTRPGRPEAYCGADTQRCGSGRELLRPGGTG